MTLDEIRRAIEAKITEHDDRAKFEKGLAALYDAELKAHDRAVAAMQADTPATVQEGGPHTYSSRRNIADLVESFLEGSSPVSAAHHIADRIDARVSQVEAALQRLGPKVRATPDGWALASTRVADAPAEDAAE